MRMCFRLTVRLSGFGADDEDCGVAVGRLGGSEADPVVASLKVRLCRVAKGDDFHTRPLGEPARYVLLEGVEGASLERDGAEFAARGIVLKAEGSRCFVYGDHYFLSESGFDVRCTSLSFT